MQKIKIFKQKNIEDFEAISGKGIKAKYDDKIYYGGNISLMKEKNIDLKSYEKKADKFSNEGKTSMYFANEKNVIGIIAVQDKPKKFIKNCNWWNEKNGLWS